MKLKLNIISVVSYAMDIMSALKLYRKNLLTHTEFEKEVKRCVIEIVELSNTILKDA